MPAHATSEPATSKSQTTPRGNGVIEPAGRAARRSKSDTLPSDATITRSCVGSYRASVGMPASILTIAETRASLRSTIPSIGFVCDGGAIPTATYAPRRDGAMQPHEIAASMSSRTSACRSPPLAKKRTASCATATTPYGYGKTPAAGAGTSSTWNDEYSSPVGSVNDATCPVLLAHHISSSAGSKATVESGRPFVSSWPCCVHGMAARDYGGVRKIAQERWRDRRSAGRPPRRGARHECAQAGRSRSRVRARWQASASSSADSTPWYSTVASR